MKRLERSVSRERMKRVSEAREREKSITNEAREREKSITNEADSRSV